MIHAILSSTGVMVSRLVTVLLTFDDALVPRIAGESEGRIHQCTSQNGVSSD
jgi:hypothetical protein